MRHGLPRARAGDPAPPRGLAQARADRDSALPHSLAHARAVLSIVTTARPNEALRYGRRREPRASAAAICGQAQRAGTPTAMGWRAAAAAHPGASGEQRAAAKSRGDGDARAGEGKD